MLKDEGDFHASAFILGPDDTTVLIREKRKPISLWKFAGGKQKLTKPFGKRRRGETPLECLIRETHEETGLWLRKRDTELVTKVDMGHYKKYYFFSRLPSFRTLVTPSDEYEEAKVFKLEDLEWLPNFDPTYSEIFLHYMQPRLAGLT